MLEFLRIRSRSRVVFFQSLLNKVLEYSMVLVLGDQEIDHLAHLVEVDFLVSVLE